MRHEVLVALGLQVVSIKISSHSCKEKELTPPTSDSDLSLRPGGPV